MESGMNVCLREESMSSFSGNDGLFQLKVFAKLMAEGSGPVFFQVVLGYKYQ